MTNDYRERLDQAIQTALVTLLKYPPSGVKVDRAYGGSCDVTFTLPDAYSAQVLGPLYAAMHAHEPPVEKAAPQYDEVTERIQKFTENWFPCVSGQGGHARLLKNMGWLAEEFPDARHVNIVCGTAQWNATCQPPWDTHELCRVFDNARDRRKVGEEPKKPEVPPYGAHQDNGPTPGTEHKGWCVVRHVGSPYLFYERQATYVTWQGASGGGWVLGRRARCNHDKLGYGSLDEALDRAKEMIG